MYKLTEEIRGTVNPSTVYGKQGEEVNKVNEFGDVWIVETIAGWRFPVHKSKLTTGEVEVKKSTDPVEIPKQNSKPAKRSIKSVAKPPQNTLF